MHHVCHYYYTESGLILISIQNNAVLVAFCIIVARPYSVLFYSLNRCKHVTANVLTGVVCACANLNTFLGLDFASFFLSLSLLHSSAIFRPALPSSSRWPRRAGDAEKSELGSQWLEGEAAVQLWLMRPVFVRGSSAFAFCSLGSGSQLHSVRLSVTCRYVVRIRYTFSVDDKKNLIL